MKTGNRTSKFKKHIIKAGVFTSSVLIIIGISISVILLQPNKAFAANSSSEYKKAIATSLKRCYESSKNIFATSVGVNDVLTKGVKKIVTKNTSQPYPVTYDGGKKVSKGCQDLFSEALGIVNLDLTTNTGDVLEKSGYDVSSTTSNGKCMQWSWTTSGSQGTVKQGTIKSYAICADTLEDGDKIPYEKKAITVKSAGGQKNIAEIKTIKYGVNIDCKVGSLGEGGCGDIKFSSGETWESFKTRVWDTIKKSNAASGYRGSESGRYQYTLDTGSFGDFPSGNVTSTYNLRSDAASTAELLSLIASDTTFSDQDKFALYQTYLVRYYGIHAISLEGLDDDVKDIRLGDNKVDGGYLESTVLSTEGVKTCLVKATNNPKKLVYGVDGSNVFGTTQKSWKELVGELNGLSGVSIDDSMVSAVTCEGDKGLGSNPKPSPSPTTPSPGSGGGGGTPTQNDLDYEGCFKEAGSMGWIICPMIFGLRDAAENIYQDWVVSLLQIDTSTIKQFRATGDEAGLYNAWGIFRNLANIIFVIILLIVIFSQLTGYGIDNYGVKRMLPRLIVGAILVNVSFIICGIAADLSNLIGAGVKNMLEGMAQPILNNINIGVSAFKGYLPAIIGGLVGIFGGAGIFAAVSSGVLSLAGWTLVLPILMFLLGAVISIIFIFITLAARQALIIVMIAISPIALAMYLLPNTNSLFKKWLDLFKALLLVYPTCSLLVGGGYLASCIILSGNTDKFFMILVAGLAAFVPYFFIPSTVSNAMKGFGNLGGMIQGFGKNFSDRLDKGIRNTRGFKEAEERRKNAGDVARARTTVRRLTTRDANGNVTARRNLSSNQAARLAAASGVVSQNDRNVLRAKASMGASSVSDDALRATAANYRDVEAQRNVQNQESLIQEGGFTDAEGNKVDANDNASLERALQLELSREEADVNVDKIKALQNILSAKNDDGRDAVTNAMKKAQSGGRTVSGKAREAYSQNIMNKWGADYKNNRSSTFQFAQANAVRGGATGDAANLTHFEKADQLKYSSLRGNTISEMDDNEFELMKKNLGKGSTAKINEDNQAAFDTAIEDAFKNENANLKTKRAADMAKYYADSHGINIGGMNNTEIINTVRDEIRKQNVLQVHNN